MKKILVITDVDFWRKGAGHRIRILKLVEFLAPRTDLTIAFIGIDEDRKENAQYHSGYQFVFLGENKLLELDQYAERLSKYLDDRNFDFCIIEYIHNAYLLNALPEDLKTILDTHDLISERTESFKEYGHEKTLFELPAELEIELFGVFDYLMLICEPDYMKLKTTFPEEKLLLCPHPPTLYRHAIRTAVKNIGFVGSEYLPNKDAVHFFIKECWPAISKKYPVQFTIYGNVIRTLDDQMSCKNIHRAGYIEQMDELYNEIDIVINPVRFGAGLKIKSVEALANGLPLVTTTHGARGLESAPNHTFWIADEPKQFIETILALIEDYSLRQKTAQRAYDFIAENFSPEKCFQPLMNIINQ
ncbi:MAG: glycosyltransferase family 4 protein [Bacteroidetes bacterium]|nr:glycosyltransferase family 4 protein [Bacteroidota bacterium]